MQTFFALTWPEQHRSKLQEYRWNPLPQIATCFNFWGKFSPRVVDWLIIKLASRFWLFTVVTWLSGHFTSLPAGCTAQLHLIFLECLSQLCFLWEHQESLILLPTSLLIHHFTLPRHQLLTQHPHLLLPSHLLSSLNSYIGRRKTLQR